MRSYEFYKWRIWIILAFSFVLSLFHRGAMGVISPYLSYDLNATASEISQIASVTFYTYALMQIPAGLLLDYYGYRKVSGIGIFITGIGSILLGLTPYLSLAFLGRLLIGLGTSVIFISVLKAQSIWFSKNDFVKVSGFLSFIGNAGGLSATFPLSILIGLIGWRFSMIGTGILCLMISILIYFFVSNFPTNYGYAPLGSQPGQTKLELKEAILSTFKNKAIWRNFFSLFTLVGCTTALSGVWGINYLTTVYHINSTHASFYISFILLGLIIGSLFISKLLILFKGNIPVCQRFCCLGISLIWFYFLFWVNGNPPLWILPFLFFSMGFLATSHILSFTDITSYCDSKHSGLASSVINAGEFIASSLVTQFIGFTLDFNFNGSIVNNIRHYSAEQFKLSFNIFFIISLMGILTSFIGYKKGGKLSLFLKFKHKKVV